jgi:Cu/Ag efflux pump CusA
MFDMLIGFSLKNRLFIIVLALVITAYGLLTLKQLPVDVFLTLTGPPSRYSVKQKAWPRKRLRHLLHCLLKPP